MKSPPYALFKKSILRACFLVSVMGVLSGPVLSHALWLPWAKEEDKVKKVVEDVWKALLWNDKKSLKEIVVGPSAPLFVEQQLAAIKKNNIKKYQCRFKSVKVDRVQGKIAFAEYYRTATLGDGRVTGENLVSVVQKIGGQWRLLPGHKNKQKNATKKSDNALRNDLERESSSNASAAPNTGATQTE